MTSIPSELVDLILCDLDNSSLLSASLTCSDWLPIARSHLRLVFRRGSEFQFRNIAATSSLAPHLRTLHLAYARYTHELLLSQFVSLRSMVIDHCVLPSDIPCFPQLHKLELHRVRFISEENVLRSFQNLPLLRTLAWNEVQWSSASDNTVLQPVPLMTMSLRLDFLYLNVYMTGFWDTISHTVYPRHLHLSAYKHQTNMELSSRYLHTIGRQLESLCIQPENHAATPVMNDGALSLVGLTALHTLELRSALHYHTSNGSYVVGFEPFVEKLLLQLTSPLDTLILAVRPVTPDATSPQAQLEQVSHLFQVLKSHRILSSLRKLRFLVEGKGNLYKADANANDLPRLRSFIEPILRAAVPAAFHGILAFEMGELHTWSKC
ncbi:hypothetical protein MIND_01168200 [Mycena indigotica]|uniref:F-box domain-containing protein n=1 Tax=Mycena indigotica TaxID=2126181 RepID=A0A8H6S3W0_9AGAR|nr:uncharacterized protein MIND_01168200 [Mycena indigotica]KAF7292700.1 hypothetical protein MIND_01168200 [Mycena indigotica]